MNKKSILFWVLILLVIMGFGIFFITSSINNQKGTRQNKEQKQAAELYYDQPSSPYLLSDLIYPVKSENGTGIAIEKKEAISEDIWNVLFIGQDARPGEKNARSDSLILVSFNKKEEKVTLTSFLRDTWVPIEGYGNHKLNAAYAFGGSGLLVNTINEVYGLDIQSYVSMNFEGFENMIQVLDGVSVAISKEEADYYNLTFPQDGEVLVGESVALTAKQALNHVNNRSVGQSDFERTRRQRDVLISIYQKIKMDADLKTIFSLLNTAKKNVETNIGWNEMMSTGMKILSYENLEIEEARVPFLNACWDETIHGQSVLMSDTDLNTEKLHALIYGI